jgi:uncharacterized protein
MVGGRLIEKSFIPVLFLAAVLAAACAAPGTESLSLPPAPVPEAGETADLDGIDQALAMVLGELVPPRDEWPPREEVRPGPEGSRLFFRSVPLSSLAYFPRLRSALERKLEQAGYSECQVVSYPDPSGEIWEIEVAIDEILSYRVHLTAVIAGRVAIIIDDCGNSLRNRKLLLAIDSPLTLAVLPRLSHTASADRLAAEQGFEVLLHCPMEGLNPDLDPGPGTLSREMEGGELAREFAENIRGVPHAVGVNNHMGSAFTTDPGAMGLLMEELKRRDLFFVDSLTVPNTATGPAAAAAGVRYLSRDIFLDHENREEFILGQLAALKKKALRRGSAIAIGHDRTLTLKILVREVPFLAEDNLRLVPVSDLLGGRGFEYEYE